MIAKKAHTQYNDVITSCSPHVYGPDVFEQSYFDSADFPENMPAIWEEHWGFLSTVSESAVVFGEWGGFYQERDKQWQDALGDYMISKSFTDNFYWSVNPNSADTGGLLHDDWTTPVNAKLQLLERINPDPSLWIKELGQICLVSTQSGPLHTTPTPQPTLKPVPTPTQVPQPIPTASSTPFPTVIATPAPSPTELVTPSPGPPEPPSCDYCPDNAGNYTSSLPTFSSLCSLMFNADKLHPGICGCAMADVDSDSGK